MMHPREIYEPRDITDNLPFDQWSLDGIIERMKRATSRSEAKGVRGDYFFIDLEGKKEKFFLVDVRAHRLGYVAKELWAVEGADSEQDFINVWLRIYGKRHPGYTFNPDRIVYTHYFFHEREISPAIGICFDIDDPMGIIRGNSQ